LTSNKFIPEEDSGKTFSNSGAPGLIQATLNSASKDGVNYSFVRIAAQNIRVKPSNGRIVYSSGIMPDGNFLSLNSNGAKLSLTYDGNGNWIATVEFGTLTEETP